MNEYIDGTPDHFRLHQQVAVALDDLDHRHVWLHISVVGGSPASAQGLKRAIEELDAWLASVRDFDFDAFGDDLEAHRPAYQALGDTFSVTAMAYNRGPDFQRSDFPLVGNPLPATADYT